MNAIITTYDVLRGAAALVRSGWCQGAFAKDSTGCHVPPHSPTAMAWDIFGAVSRSAGGDGNLAAAALHRLDVMSGEEPMNASGLAVMTWNDKHGRTVSDVADLLERAAVMESLA